MARTDGRLHSGSNVEICGGMSGVAVNRNTVLGDPCDTVRWTAVQRTAPQGYTFYMYCCHNTGIDGQDFKFGDF